MTTVASRLETGSLVDTPVDDNLLRRFVHNQADVNELVAGAAGGHAERVPGVFLADARSPVAYLNQAVLARPVRSPDDEVLDAVDAFFARSSHGATVLSPWPTPDLASRGWYRAGHPMFVVRAPGPHGFRPPADVEVDEARSAADLLAVERVAIEAYPLPEAARLPPGSTFPPALADTALKVRLGCLGGEPVAAANAHVGHGVVNLCFAATLPAARRRGVWASLVWARVDDAPDLPAVAFTSDDSRPGFVRMGFLPLFRFTLWVIPGRRVGDL